MSTKKKLMASASSLFKVSQSKIATWRRCRREYHYAHVEKIAPKKKARPLAWGSIAHNMIDAEIKGGNPFKVLKDIGLDKMKLFAAEREEYGDIIQDLRFVFTEYFDYWDEHPETLQYFSPVKQFKCEVPFEVELDKGNILAKGRIDAFGKAKKLKWIVEHKNHKTFPKPEHRWRNLQSVFYIRIAQLMGWGTMDGTCWDYIRSKAPTRPQILKSGELSRRELDSLPVVVRDVLKQNKLKETDYADVIKEQEANRSSYFQRIFTPVTKAIIEPIMTDVLETSREMMDLHEKSKVRTFGRHCEWCKYNRLCAAELQGHDVDFIKEREYEFNEYEAEEIQRQEIAD